MRWSPSSVPTRGYPLSPIPYRLASDALQVLVGARVNLDQVALVEEERHIHHQAGLQRGWLRAAGGGVASQARISALNTQHRRDRNLHVNRLPLVGQEVNGLVLLQIVHRVAQDVCGQWELLEGLGVHEVVF